MPRESFERRHGFYSCDPRNGRRSAVYALRATRVRAHVCADCSFIFSRGTDESCETLLQVRPPRRDRRGRFYTTCRDSPFPPAPATFSAPERNQRLDRASFVISFREAVERGINNILIMLFFLPTHMLKSHALFRLFCLLSLTSSFVALAMRGALSPRQAKSDETRKFSTGLIYGDAARSKGVTKMKRFNTSVLLLL